MKRMKNYKDYLIESLKDPLEAQAYLEVTLEEYKNDRDLAALMYSLQALVQAQGGMAQLAKRSHVNRQNLYKIFSGKRSPKWETMEAILNGLGFRTSIKPLNAESHLKRS